MSEVWNEFEKAFFTEDGSLTNGPKTKSNLGKELLESYPLLEAEAIQEDIAWLEDNKLDISLFKYDILPNTLNAVIAPTHTGKTYFLINLAYELASKGKVLYITTEQTVREIRRIFYEMYIKNKDMPIMAFAKNDPKNIKIEYMKSGTIEKVSKEFEKIAKVGGYDFLIIDYITADLIHDARGEYTAASQLAASINEIFIIQHPTTVFTALQANTAGQQAARNQIRSAALSIGQYMREGSKALDLFHSISFLGMIGVDDEPNNKGRLKQRYITTCKARFNPTESIGEQYYVKFNPDNLLITLEDIEINKKDIGLKNNSSRAA